MDLIYHVPFILIYPKNLSVSSPYPLDEDHTHHVPFIPIYPKNLSVSSPYPLDEDRANFDSLYFSLF
jgi:hypothetical protein